MHSAKVCWLATLLSHRCPSYLWGHVTSLCLKLLSTAAVWLITPLASRDKRVEFYTAWMDALDRGIIHVLGDVLRGMERDDVRLHHATQNGLQFKTHELFISETFHLIWPCWNWTMIDLESAVIIRGWWLLWTHRLSFRTCILQERGEKMLQRSNMHPRVITTQRECSSWENSCGVEGGILVVTDRHLWRGDIGVPRHKRKQALVILPQNKSRKTSKTDIIWNW